MMSKDTIVELSVAKLFANGQYAIPTYQRNYAWGETEVEQLLQDVLDIARLQGDQTPCDRTNYYIGTLVVDAKGNQTFETIDGQQRHTTLSIILSVLKNEFSGQVTLPEGLKLNLAFNSRPKSSTTLAKLFEGETERCEQPSMLGAYQVATRFLKEQETHLPLFTKYLLHRVKILRVPVPQHTDLNHYFEIMNNRGEQLEKHEVLKARLMGALEQTQQSCFAAIWDACASMDRYVQLGFADRSLRTRLFGEEWDRCPASFIDAYEHLKSAEIKPDGAGSRAPTLAEIISQPQLREDTKKKSNGAEDPGKHGSIVNFPNFLLQVLRVTKKPELTLDDKRLLEIFEEHNKGKSDAEKAQFAREFVIDLLKCRLLLDRYIIKRDDEAGWGLQCLKPSKDGHYFANTTDDPRLNKQLTMLLSMFHVSYPTQAYKHWLSAALHYLFKNTRDGQSVKTADYRDFLEALSDRFFYGRFGEDGQVDYETLAFSDDVIDQEFDREHLNQRTQVHNFIFNRLDYLLWKKLSTDKEFATQWDRAKRRAESFSFTFRSSVEHYYPQNPLDGKKLDEATLHRFGNLCLISPSQNSRVSNLPPAEKSKLYDRAKAESLKLAFMMSYGLWGPECPEVISEHEEMMVKVLCSEAQLLNRDCSLPPT